MAESTDFSRSRYSTGKKDFWKNLRNFSRYFARAELTSSAAPSELFQLLPKISGFVGQPCQSVAVITSVVATMIVYTFFTA